MVAERWPAGIRNAIQFGAEASRASAGEGPAWNLTSPADAIATGPPHPARIERPDHNPNIPTQRPPTEF